MKQYFGNYLGLCINNDDPEKRGRVQVFIPHIMPALYENWNQVGEDIKVLCVGNNLPNSIPPDTYEKLKKILPWCESASPIIGTSAPGNLVDGEYVQNPDAVASGTNATISNLNGLLNDALQYAGGGTLGSTVRSRIFGRSGGGACARGTMAVLGALTNNSAFRQGTAGGDAWDYALGGTPSSDRFKQSGIYQSKQALPSNYRTDSSQWQLGDVVALGNHIQVWTGSQWVSDYQQGSNANGSSVNGGTGRGGNGALHRLTPQGLAQTTARVQQRYGGLLAGEVSPGAPGSSQQSASTSGQIAASSGAQPTNTPINENPEDNNYGNAARPEVVFNNSIKTQVRNFNGTQPEAFAVVRDAAARAGSPDPNITASIAMLESGYLTSSMSKRANNPFGQTIILSQIGSNGIIGSTKGRDRQDHAVYDSLESAMAFHVRRWGSRYVAGDINATTRNLIQQTFDGSPSGSYNSVDPSWSSDVKKLYSGFTGQNVQAPDNLAGPAPAGGDSRLVNNPDPNGPTAVMNINNMAKGVFSYPAAGSLLWIFFREGDPHFPVYFATSYGASEWQSAYRQGSDVAGYQPAPRPENPVTSTGGNINLGGVGGIRWEDTNAGPNDPTKDEKSILFYSYDGSNMFFNEGYHQIFSKFDRRDQVEGDRFESTLGYKEEWVQGDSNCVTMGDVYIKIGNVSQTAVNAVKRIQEIIKEIMEPLAESSGGGSGAGGGSSKQPSSYTKDAEKNAVIKDMSESILDFEIAGAGNRENNVNEGLGTQSPPDNSPVGQFIQSPGATARRVAERAATAFSNAGSTIISQPSNLPGGAGSATALGGDFPSGGF